MTNLKLPDKEARIMFIYFHSVEEAFIFNLLFMKFYLYKIYIKIYIKKLYKIYINLYYNIYIKLLTRNFPKEINRNDIAHKYKFNLHSEN